MRRQLLWIVLLMGFLNLGFGPPAVVDVAEGGTPVYATQVPAINSLRLPAVGAGVFAVLDGDTGKLIAGRGPHDRVAPASTTKIATAIIAIERGRLDEMVRIDVDRTQMADSSLMGLVLGDRVSLRDLLYGLLLPSGNDAAIAIARHIGGDEAGFVKLMNEKASNLGLEDTHFVNPHGLDDLNHYSSAYDLAVLARYAMRLPDFAAIVRQTSYVARGAEHVYRMVNTNHLLGDYPGLDGVKTGYTENAGEALVSTAARDGRRVYVAVLRSENRIADTVPLLDYYLDNYQTRTLELPATALNQRPRSNGGAISLVPKPLPRLTLPVWQWPYVQPRVYLDEEVPENLWGELRLGFVGYYLGNQLLAEAPVYAR